MLIYKILRGPEWDELEAAGQSSGSALDKDDGYIHLSTAAQVSQTAARHFAGLPGLWLLALQTDQLGAALAWEPSRGGTLFPHLYAPLRRADVTWSARLPLIGGQHQFPPLE